MNNPKIIAALDFNHPSRKKPDTLMTGTILSIKY
jgi:hypothetical protein